MSLISRSLFKRKSSAEGSAVSMPVRNLHVVRKNVKHARIMVHHDGKVHFVAPMRYSDEKIKQLVHKHTPWIEKQRQRFSTIARIDLRSNELLYRGKVYRFVQKVTMGEDVVLYPDHNIVCSGVNLLQPSIQEQWYKSEAQRIITKRVEILSERTAFHFSAVRVSSPKTIWGSCTAKDGLTFNWRLIKAPPFVLDYLILHELVHTEVRDHSRRFWNRVSEVCPRTDEAVEWLKTYGRWI